MTTAALTPHTTGQLLSQAAARATLAPSIHNTQPWRFVVHPDRLELFAEPGRRLAVLDPSGRQLTISCGAALFGARVALAAARLDAVTAELPDPHEPDLLAVVTIAGHPGEADDAAHRLDACAGLRHSNRRQFAPEPVPEHVLDALGYAARVERAWLRPVAGEEGVTLAVLSQFADDLQTSDPAYRAELRAWTGAGPDRADGIPASAIPHNTGTAHDAVPIRDFDSFGTGQLPTETRTRLTQTFAVLGTDGDGPRDWLIAGQALGRVLLEVTDAGLVASILSQVIEEPGTREQLREALHLTGHPQLLLRIGFAERTGATPRRPLREVIRQGAAGPGPAPAG